MPSKVFEHPFDLTKVRLQSQVLDATASESATLARRRARNISEKTVGRARSRQGAAGGPGAAGGANEGDGRRGASRENANEGG